MQVTENTIAVLVRDPADRCLLSNALRDAGYRVIDDLGSAGEPSSIEMVIADEAMGRLLSPELAALRLRSPDSFIPALVLLPRKRASTYWLENGFNDVLRLPCNYPEVLSRVRAFLILKSQSEEAFRRVTDRNRAILELAPDAFVVLDCDNNILEFNAAAEQMFGHDRRQAIGASFADLVVPPHLRQRHRDGLLAFARTGSNAQSSRRMKVTALRASGEEFPAEVTATRISVRNEFQIAGFVRDLTAQTRAEAGLAHLAAIVEGSDDAIVSKTLDGRILTWNNAAERLFGYTRDEAVGMPITKLFPPGEECEESRIIGAVVSGEKFVGQWTRRRHRDGHVIDVSVSVAPIRDPQGRIVGASKIARDISRRRKRDDQIRKLLRVQAVLSGINATMVRVSERETLFSEACRIAVEHGGFSMAWIGVVDRNQKRVEPCAWDGEGVREFLDAAPPVATDGISGTGNLVERAVNTMVPAIRDDIEHELSSLLKAEFTARGIRSTVALPLIVSGSVVGIFVLYAQEAKFFDEEEMKVLVELAADISFGIDHLDKDARVRYLAYYDSLTGLANSALFAERINQTIRAIAQAAGEFAVVVVDIDRFRAINESLGRSAGDALLKTVAGRLAVTAGETEVGRIGIDQFAVLFSGIKEPSEVSRMVQTLLRQCFDETVAVGDTPLSVAAKVGIALFPHDGADAETLLNHAEAALRRSKKTGEPISYYMPALTERTAATLTLENRLRRALENEEFVLHYQPKVNLETPGIPGVEALIRWQSPEFGLVPPMQFIPLMEETGLIIEAGTWALRRAALDHRRWVAAGVPSPRVAVNVSPIQLRRANFVEVVKAAIHNGAEPSAIDLEITETLLMEDIDETIRKLTELSELGTTVAIDDFGTGYSSLAYLARLPVQALKIDRSFIVTMLNDTYAMSLVQMIISLAHTLRLKVVAEGVEHEDQAKLLRLLRCDQMQGYLFSRPVPFDEMTELLRKSARGPGQMS